VVLIWRRKKLKFKIQKLDDGVEKRGGQKKIKS
jgi:hypothetical protein